MDDILIFGKDKHEHDARLKKVLDRLSQSGLALSPEKFEFSKRQLNYLSQAINASRGENNSGHEGARQHASHQMTLGHSHEVCAKPG